MRVCFYDVMSPIERADYVYTAAFDLRSPEAIPWASLVRK
jgi:hypothetical protein